MARRDLDFGVDESWIAFSRVEPTLAAARRRWGTRFLAGGVECPSLGDVVVRAKYGDSSPAAQNDAFLGGARNLGRMMALDDVTVFR